MDYRITAMADESDELVRRIIEAVGAVVNINDRSVRTAVIASALVTAGQVLDGNEMPEETEFIKPEGITDLMLFCLESNKRKMRGD